MRADRARAETPGLIRAVEIIRVRLPLVRSFRSALGETTHKEALLVRVVTDDAEGWGECAAEATPTYAGETLDTARLTLRDHLIPRAFAAAGFDDVRGCNFARAALEAARLDAELRSSGQSLAAHLGGVRSAVDAGVAIGMIDDRDELRALAASYVAGGYRRLKLKIAPGSDIGPVAAVRAEVGDDVALAVDANGTYTLDDADALAALAAYDLQCIEQPLPPDALVDHATLGELLRSPICLDETVTSVRVAAEALALRACRMVNVKPARVGGVLAACAIHDVCTATAVPVIIGGMLETGVGRAVNVALASLPGFTEAGDLSASDRYFDEDLTEPFVLEDGKIRVPDGAGIGVTPGSDRLRAHTVMRETLRP